MQTSLKEHFPDVINGVKWILKGVNAVGLEVSAELIMIKIMIIIKFLHWYSLAQDFYSPELQMEL